MKKPENEINVSKDKENKKVVKDRKSKTPTDKKVKKPVKTKSKQIKNDKEIDKKEEVNSERKTVNKKIGLKKRLENFKGILLNKRFQLFMAIIAAIVIIVEIIYLIICINLNLTYAKYTDKMKVYGFEEQYNNKGATAYESITKGEAIKLVISAIYNMNDITDFAYEPEFEDKNAIWATYAVKEGIISEKDINKSNINNSVSYLEVLRYFTKAREELLGVYTDMTEVSLKFKGINKLNQEEKYYIEDAVASGLIVNNSSRFVANKKITKGEMNRLVINFVTSFNTITNKDVVVNTDKNNYPKNADEYPYIADGISKEIYEIPFYFENSKAIYTPVQLYKYRKEFFEQAVERLNSYYDIVLNIDYKTIKVEEFKKSLNDILQYRNKDAEYEAYVKYVQDNKLVIKGKLTPFVPIIYVDGSNYRVRSKIELEIVEGNTKKSVIFGDLRLPDGVTYSNNKLTFYIDAPMETSLTSYSMYPITSPLVKNISGQVNNALLNII